jgi:hypothetical protein
MRAEWCEDGAIVVSGAARQEKFKKIWAGIGWPDADPGHLCVVGERTDRRYHAFRENSGGLAELGDAAIECKDRFLVEIIYVDSRDAVATSYLRTLDGLCFYGQPSKDDVTNTGQDVTRPLWPHFRDRTTTAIVAPVPDRIVTSYRSALEKTRGVILRGKLLIHESQCPKLVYTLRQPLDELLGSPAMKALVWVVAALEDSSGNPDLADTTSDPWYTNWGRSTV